MHAIFYDWKNRTVKRTSTDNNDLADYIIKAYLPLLPHDTVITFGQFADKIERVYSVENPRNLAAVNFLRNYEKNPQDEGKDKNMKYTDQLKAYCEKHGMSYQKTRDRLLASFDTWEELESWVKKSPSPQDAIEKVTQKSRENDKVQELDITS